MQEVIPVSNQRKWNKLLEKCPQSDIHFTPGYLSPFENHMEAQALLYHYRRNGVHILYPFFKRGIPGVENMDNVYDVISPWYYGGFPSSEGLKSSELRKFFKKFREYCTKNDIVSGFTRIHPYFENSKLRNNFENVNKIGRVVYLNPQKDSIKKIFGDLRRDCRRAIRTSKEEDAEVFVNRREDLGKFHRLYTDAMEAKGADDFYFFSFNFLSELWNNLEENFYLITTWHEEDLVAGSVFLRGYGKMYYWLSVRDPEKDEGYGSNRCIWEAIKIAHTNDVSVFDLGGGHESLLEFKKSFSDKSKKLFGQKAVYSKDKYRKICNFKNIHDIKFEKADFFPEYRR